MSGCKPVSGMCMGPNAARDGFLRDNGSHEEEEQDVTLHDVNTMALRVWPPVEVEEESPAEEENEVIDETRVGYLQISDEPSGEAIEEQDAQASNTVARSDGSSLAGAVVSNGRHAQERIVTVNGMEFHVYGNVTGLELVGSNGNQDEDHPNMLDSVEEEEEERRRAAVERAIAEANAADAARRAAPIPPEHRARIVNAMKGIDLGGFRPSWADRVPEDQWIDRIKENANSSQK